MKKKSASELEDENLALKFQSLLAEGKSEAEIKKLATSIGCKKQVTQFLKNKLKEDSQKKIDVKRLQVEKHWGLLQSLERD